MATKTEITTHINTDLASGSSIPASNHRGVLHTDTDSVLENIYMTPITDVSDGTKTITTSNSNFSYTVTFTKTGRVINIKGQLKNISGLSTTPRFTVFEIADAEYYPKEDSFSVANALLIGEDIEARLYMRIMNNTLAMYDTLLPDEELRFNFNYNALD